MRQCKGELWISWPVDKLTSWWVGRLADWPERLKAMRQCKCGGAACKGELWISWPADKLTGGQGRPEGPKVGARLRRVRSQRKAR